MSIQWRYCEDSYAVVVCKVHCHAEATRPRCFDRVSCNVLCAYVSCISTITVYATSVWIKATIPLGWGILISIEEELRST